jgi:hypothetical protein
MNLFAALSSVFVGVFGPAVVGWVDVLYLLHFWLAVLSGSGATYSHFKSVVLAFVYVVSQLRAWREVRVCWLFLLADMTHVVWYASLEMAPEWVFYGQLGSSAAIVYARTRV